MPGRLGEARNWWVPPFVQPVMKRPRTSAILIGLVVLVSACGGEATLPSNESTTTAPTTTSAPDPAPAVETAVPAPPMLIERTFPQPSWVKEALADVSGVLDVWIAPEDSAVPIDLDVLSVRLFADAEPDTAERVVEAFAEIGVTPKAEPTFYPCPYSEAEFEEVTAYLGSFEWADPGRPLPLRQFAPWAAELGAYGHGHCVIWFPLEIVSAEEVDRIRTFAVDRNVEWIDFWAGDRDAMEYDPLALPASGLPHIEVP